MKVTELVRVISRLLAVYVLIQFVNIAPFYLSSFFLRTISILLYILLFYFLWFRSDWIAKVIVQNDETLFEHAITANQLQSILFSAVGVLTLTTVIPQITQTISQTWIESSMLDSNQFKVRMIPQYIGMLIKLFIGLWLLFGAKGLMNLLKRIKK